jgi:RNA polymerase sigma-70 factor (ECF subfamily)
LLQQEETALQREKDTKMAIYVAQKWRPLRFGRMDGTTAGSDASARLGHTVTEHLDALYSYALVISRDPTEAEDLVQETCARAIRAIGSLRENSNVKSWLFTILRNIWLNQLRQQRATPKLIELDVDESTADIAVEKSEDPLASYISMMEREQVRWAIQQLPVQFREVIVLREYEDLSYEEIATLLKVPAGTVMSRLARARYKLRELLLVAGKPSVEKGGTAAE